MNGKGKTQGTELPLINRVAEHLRHEFLPKTYEYYGMMNTIPQMQIKSQIEGKRPEKFKTAGNTTFI